MNEGMNEYMVYEQLNKKKQMNEKMKRRKIELFG